MLGEAFAASIVIPPVGISSCRRADHEREEAGGVRAGGGADSSGGARREVAGFATGRRGRTGFGGQPPMSGAAGESDPESVYPPGRRQALRPPSRLFAADRIDVLVEAALARFARMAANHEPGGCRREGGSSPDNPLPSPRARNQAHRRDALLLGVRASGQRRFDRSCNGGGMRAGSVAIATNSAPGQVQRAVSASARPVFPRAHSRRRKGHGPGANGLRFTKRLYVQG